MLLCSNLYTGTSRAGSGRGQSVSDSMISSFPEIVSRVEGNASCNEWCSSDGCSEKIICGYYSSIRLSRLELIDLILDLCPVRLWRHNRRADNDV